MADRPEAGAVYGFQTEHSFDWKTGETGRFGAFKFIGFHRDSTPVVIVFDGVFDRLPQLDDVTDLPILRCNRGAFNNKPEILGMYNYTPDQLAKFPRLGAVPVTPEDARIAEACRTFGGLGGIGISLELEWRSVHEPEAYAADIERYGEERRAKREAEQAHYNNRLKGLTFEILLGETLFENWTPSPPFPSEEFVVEARAELRGLMETLQALGEKPKKAAARKAMKASVERLNEMDMRFDGVIETEEREDLCEALIEIAHAARQPKLGDEVDEWRDW